MPDYVPPQHLVGRSEELARLHEFWQSAREGRGQTVFVTGEAGMGKSTLVEAFIAQVAASRQKGGPVIQIARGNCSQQFGREEAFLPFAEALGDLLKKEASDQSTARKLLGVIYDSAPAWMGIVPVVGGVLSGVMETAKSAREHFGGQGQAQVSQPDQSRMLQEYTNAVLALAQRGPVLLFLDDLHWADAATVALLAHLARRIASQPVFIVGTYRPSDLAVAQHPLYAARRELDRYKACTEIALTTFDRTGFAAVVSNAFPDHALPEDFLDRLYEQTGGVPLYVVETLTYLRDDGIIGQVEGRWQLTGTLENIQLPASVEAVIQKRLERLDEEQGRAMQYASVEGTDFTSIVLSQLLEQDELAIEERLEKVEKTHHLIQFDSEVELGNDLASRYRFSHALFQKVLYDALRGKRLILLHRRVGEAMERLYGDKTGEVAHQLAIHFEAGGLPEKSLTYTLQAAQRAIRLYAWEEAALGFERAERLAEHASAPDAVAVQVKEGQGDIALARACYHDAIAAYDAASEALDLALVDDENEVRARLHRKRARACEFLGDYAAAFAALDEGLRLAPPESLEKAALHVMGAGLHHRQGRHRQALAWCEEALAANGLPKVHPLRAHAESLRGVMNVYLGHPDEALSPLNLALKIYTRLEDLPGRFDVCSNLGLTHFTLAGAGDWARAKEYHEQARALAERMNDSERLARANLNLGWLAYCLGDTERAIDAFVHSLRTWTESGARLMGAIVHNTLGAAELACGQHTAALAHLQRAVDVLVEVGAHGQLAETRRFLALTHLAIGDLPTAHKEAGEALDLARTAEAQLDEAAAQRVLGQVALAEGNLDAAASALAASCVLLDGDGNRYERGQTLVALAELERRRGQTTRVDTLLTDAIAIFADLGAARELQQARALAQDR
ncbi:MAG: AAA family ATPase [Anaerolineae bacterium]|nr:AAA family ATPase [Anaerolineae bacterium]